jgi:menaquinol-cytochrome c reductase cytochrome b/c subunit
MNEQQKKEYKERYLRAKRNGEKFFPDALYKDALISFAIFLLLVGLALFIGVAPEPRADPSDITYIPRPEWYFLFLFEMLKFFPGSIEWLGTAVIPGAAVIVLLLLPFIDRNPARHWKKRKIAIAVMSVIVIGMVALTVRAVITTPPSPAEAAVATSLTAKISAGQDAFSEKCAECHSAEGEGGVIQGVKGLEGYKMKPINTSDEMYTRNDESLFSIIEYGQPNLGMPPQGKAYGGEMGRSEIDNVVTFMRYTWDDRVEKPKEAVQAGAIPALGPDEVPSYDAHIAPIIKRYCISCHRPGKDNNDYLMGSYEDVMNSGEHKPNIIPGDLTSNLIRMLDREEITAGGAMPPTKALKPELIEMFKRWVKAGAPQTVKK